MLVVLVSGVMVLAVAPLSAEWVVRSLRLTHPRLVAGQKTIAHVLRAIRTSIRDRDFLATYIAINLLSMVLQTLIYYIVFGQLGKLAIGGKRAGGNCTVVKPHPQ
jgi:hypothetical protein